MVLLPGKILITFKVNLNVLLKPFPIHNMTTSGLVAELKKYNEKPMRERKQGSRFKIASKDQEFPRFSLMIFLLIFTLGLAPG